MAEQQVGRIEFGKDGTDKAARPSFDNLKVSAPSDDSKIDQMLQAAKKAQPNLWRRTEQVARVLDPAAWSDDWVLHGDEQASLYSARQKYLRAASITKAQEVLKVLGVNTDTDWMDILRIMGEREVAGENEQAGVPDSNPRVSNESLA